MTQRMSLSEEAAELLVELENEDTQENRLKVQDWITQSPAHLEAMLFTSIAFREFQKIDEARDAAVRRLYGGNVVVGLAWLNRRT